MRAQLLQLMTDILVDVLEGVKERGRDRCGSCSILDSVAQILFGGKHQSAICMVDDHEFPGVQKVVGDDQGTQGIFRDDAAGVSNDMGVAGFQAESANRKPRIHASEDGKMALWARREPPQFVSARIELVSLKNFVDYAHSRFILANRDRWNRVQLICRY